ncbi:MAG: hypothetical protein JO366_13935 [Methylobacteriaceae bacterium]|nr:hypothetical protein [Methylobacteriaceae bacterium]MBV9245905.1 hypothetical protein [Methylobacteriaceae bacterium]
MSYRIIAALTLSVLSFANCPLSHAQKVSIEELKQQLAEARNVETKLRAMGISIEKDCPFLVQNLQKTGDDRYVFAKKKDGTTLVITIREYRQRLQDNTSNAPDKIKQYLETADRRALAWAQDCKSAMSIADIEKDITAAGSALAQFVWAADYGGETIEAEGTVSKGYPEWKFKATKLRASLPDWPRGKPIEIDCHGSVDGGGGPVPAQDSPGKMTCKAEWGEEGKKTAWECQDAAGKARTLGPGGTQSFFFLAYKCHGDKGGVKDHEFYEMGIRWNALGAYGDPPWGEYKSVD